MLKLYTIIKNNKLINKLKIALIISFIFFYFNSQGISLTSDSTKPIIIVADYFEINYANNYAVYAKNVELNQGTRKLNSDNLYIYFKKGNKIDAIIATRTQNNHKKLVSYYEKMDKQHGKEDIMHAQAEKFTFNPNINKIILEQNAIIRQGDKELLSELIRYDIKKQIAEMPKHNNSRTKITIG